MKLAVFQDTVAETTVAAVVWAARAVAAADWVAAGPRVVEARAAVAGWAVDRATG